MDRPIEIWSPKWKNRTVLIKCERVKDGWNYLRFTKTPSMTGLYQFNGTAVREQCEVQSNGKILCFAVPLYMLMEVDERKNRQPED